MAKLKSFIVFILIVVAFGAGVYFSAQGGPASGWKDDAVNFYNNFNKQVKDFEKTDIGQIISEVGKQIFAPSPLNVGGSKNNVLLLQNKVILETNLQRKENGNLPALIENLRLNEAALAKANDIFLNQYFEHISPVGIDPGKLVQENGYSYIVVGENLILGNFSSEKEVVQNWMDSPGHRENILNNRYTEIGVAVVKGNYKGENVWVGVQEFGLPSSTCSEPNVAFKNQIDAEKSQLDLLSSLIQEDKDQINKTNPKSAPYGQMIDDYNQLVAEYNLLADKLKEDIVNFNNQVNIFNNCVAGK